MEKTCTTEQALMKAEAYCSVAEHCKEEVYCKLKQWGAPLDSFEAIVNQLETEGFIDERRYARAFVRDKYRFAQWGRQKILQALKMKRLPACHVTKAINEIDEEEYMDILTSLLRKKQGSIKANTDYERTGKLIRYAVGKGYETGIVMDCLKRIGYGDEYLE